ncbi:MAG: 5-oxopent-3-ene-1,2,5-tricarboxylate decarboxylase, partial [Pseudomonadota bacterium]
MKLLTFTHAGSTRVGALRGDDIVDLHATDAEIPADMRSLLEGGDSMLDRARAAVDNGEVCAALAD